MQPPSRTFLLFPSGFTLKTIHLQPWTHAYRTHVQLAPAGRDCDPGLHLSNDVSEVRTPPHAFV